MKLILTIEIPDEPSDINISPVTDQPQSEDLASLHANTPFPSRLFSSPLSKKVDLAFAVKNINGLAS